MLLLSIVGFLALLAYLAVRIATSPPFQLLFCLFAGWADRCREEAGPTS